MVKDNLKDEVQRKLRYKAEDIALLRKELSEELQTKAAEFNSWFDSQKESLWQRRPIVLEWLKAQWQRVKSNWLYLALLIVMSAAVFVLRMFTFLLYGIIFFVKLLWRGGKLTYGHVAAWIKPKWAGFWVWHEQLGKAKIAHVMMLDSVHGHMSLSKVEFQWLKNELAIIGSLETDGEKAPGDINILESTYMRAGLHIDYVPMGLAILLLVMPLLLFLLFSFVGLILAPFSLLGAYLAYRSTEPPTPLVLLRRDGSGMHLTSWENEEVPGVVSPASIRTRRKGELQKRFMLSIWTQTKGMSRKVQYGMIVAGIAVIVIGAVVMYDQQSQRMEAELRAELSSRNATSTQSYTPRRDTQEIENGR